MGTTVAPPPDYRQEIVDILNTVSNTVLLPPENIEVVADVAVRLPVERCNVVSLPYPTVYVIVMQLSGCII